MAAPGNQNQQPGGGPFDVQRLFNPSSSPPPPITTTFQNPNHPYPPPYSAASYPPPTVAGGGPYSYYPPQTNQLFHHQYHVPPPPFHPQQQPENHLPSNLQHQRSLPYPTIPLQPPSPNNTNPNDGARLMALLSPPPPSIPDIPSQSSVPLPNPNPTTMLSSSTGQSSMPSSKLPKGRHLVGDRVVYDIDVRLPGEIQPQLAVNPITKYGSDPCLVVGRQIAVNKTYICYGLKAGAIRVLSISTASRALLKGFAKRVTDMAFFAEDVHLLASASMDGRVYVWKIAVDPDLDDKQQPQIAVKIVTAVQFVGEGDQPVHPRVCWHCHKQEVLVVGIGNRILRFDTTKIGRGETYSADEPLTCHVDKLMNGIQFVGKHDGDITDLSMCQWMTSRLVSSSVDGTIKIWEDHKSSPTAVLRPHDGLPVNSVTFLTSPNRPDHIILITGGPLNREIKIWISDSEEGWLLPSDADSWRCTQTLELKSSETRIEDSFFNQVVALSQWGVVLLANAKNNAIYAVHLDYGPNPESTRMDYIAEFTVTMPILSFTGTRDILSQNVHIIHVYCVQTQAIQEYALDLSQCLPPPSSEPSGIKLDDVAFTEASFNETDISCVVPSSPKFSRNVSDIRTPSGGFEQPNNNNGNYDDQKKVLETCLSNMSNTPSLDDDVIRTDESKSVKDVKFMHPTHLVTPAELMATSSSDVSTTHDVAVSPDTQNAELELKVVGTNADEAKEKSKAFMSQASGLMARESYEVDDVAEVEQQQTSDVEETEVVGPALKLKKKKGKSGQIAKSTTILSQIQSMQEAINQMLINQKEIRKQIPEAVAGPVAKELKRLEAGIGKSMERFANSNSEAYVARCQEEFAKQEKSNRDRHQQVATSAGNGHKELVAACEKVLKKELGAVGPAVGRLVTPVVEKAVTTAVTEAFQRGVGDKAANQLEKAVNSKLEATVSRQIQAQFQTSGKQALQEALKSTMEASVLPAFELSCKTMFDQIDSTFQKGMVDHTTASHQQVESMHSPLAFALRDTINSASSITQTLSGELTEGQRKLVALAGSKSVNPLLSQISNGPTGGFHDKIEDPTKELSRLVHEFKYEEAFTSALQRSDVRIVSWLCSQVDLQGILTSNPLPLSQGVLLSLLQQLACDIGNDASRKLGWMMDVVVAIKPTDGIIAMHVRPIFEQVYSILNHQVGLPTNSVAELSSIRVVMRLLNSTLRSM